MTQDDHLERGHQTNKTVNDQIGDDASSTSGRVSAKNSGTRNSKSPLSSTKVQQTDRRIKQYNKSAIGKRSTGANVKVSIVERDRNGQKSQNSRKDADQPCRLTVGNRSDRSSPCPDDKENQTEMTVINQSSGNESIRDSKRSDIVDNFKDTSDTASVNNRIEDDSDRAKLSVSENSLTTIDTDLQSNGSTSGTSPTTSQHKNNSNDYNSNNDTNVTEKKDAGEDHAKIERENNACVDFDKLAVDSSDSRESRIKPIPKTVDPIERLNALRANISSTLKEVKAVLDKHTPPQRLADESDASNVGDDGAVKFRFVKRVRTKSFKKFEDEEIICNVPAEGSSRDTQQEVKQERSEKIADQIKETDNVEAAKIMEELPKEPITDKRVQKNTTEDTKREGNRDENIETMLSKDTNTQKYNKIYDTHAKVIEDRKQGHLSVLLGKESSTTTLAELDESPDAKQLKRESLSPKLDNKKTKKRERTETSSVEKNDPKTFKNEDQQQGASASNTFSKEVSPKLEVGKFKRDKPNKIIENHKNLQHTDEPLKNEWNLKTESAIPLQDDRNETSKDSQTTKKLLQNKLSPRNKSSVEMPGNLNAAGKLVVESEASENDPNIKITSLPKKLENSSTTKDRKDILKAKIPKNDLKFSNEKDSPETKEVNSDTKLVTKDTIKPMKDLKSEKEEVSVETKEPKIDTKSSQENVTKDTTITMKDLKSTLEKSVPKSKEVKKNVQPPQKKETSTIISSRDSKISEKTKANKVKPDPKLSQGKVIKKQMEPTKEVKSMSKKVVQTAEESKKDTQYGEAKDASKEIPKNDASEKSLSKIEIASESLDKKLPTKASAQHEKEIPKPLDRQTFEKTSTVKSIAKLVEDDKEVKLSPEKVNQKLKEPENPSKCPNESMSPPEKDKKYLKVSSISDGKISVDKTTPNLTNKISELKVEKMASKSATTATATETTTKEETALPLKLQTTTTPDTNLKPDSEPPKVEGKLIQRTNLDAKASASEAVSQPQSKPPLQPPRKPVETCANIEQKVLEILSQKKEEKRIMTPISETVKPAGKEEVIKVSTEEKQAETSNAQKITDKVQQLPPSSTSPKTIVKDKPDSSVKEIESKTPVSLRMKRVSLSESPKDSIRDKVAIPKRSSIGSESELSKFATKSSVNPVKKTVKDGTSPNKKPNISKQASLDLESKKTESASVSDIIQNANSGIKTATTTSGASSKAINQSYTKIAVATNSSAAVKDAPSASVQSKNDSTTEIIQTPSSASIATRTQPAPIKSDSDAKIPTVPSEKSLDVIKPLISSADKLVSSESVGPSSKNSVEKPPSNMTVVKKDIVSNITPTQPLDELNMKAKESHGISESLQNNLDALSKYSAESKILKDTSTVVKTEPIIVLNGEVKPKDILVPALEQVPADPQSSRLVKSDSIETIQGNDLSESNVHSKNQASQTPAKLEFAGINKKGLTRLVKKDKDIEDSVDIPVTDDVKGSAESDLTKDSTQKKVVEVSPTAVPENEVISTPTPTQNESNNIYIQQIQSVEVDITVDDQKIPLQKSASTDTDDLTQTGESESDSGPKSPTAKKVRKTKKVIIKRVKRRLSLVDEAVPEQEVCEKPIAEPPISEEIAEEPVEEEPPAPKGPKPCLVRRSYEPGDIVLYADRIRKNVVKWKKATVLEKITDHSYKLAFEDMQKPAHISYIKKFTAKKVQFGGKEYLEIDYAQDEYASSDEEVPYNIWARA